MLVAGWAIELPEPVPQLVGERRELGLVAGVGADAVPGVVPRVSRYSRSA